MRESRPIEPPPAAYPTDVVYPAAYFRELAPVWLSYVGALRGVAAPDPTRPFRYLEVGCGSGLSVAVHAAANPQAEFHACDFNAAAVRAARRRARHLDADNLIVHHATFTDMAELDPAPFDYVIAHGVYSWVEPDQRQALVDVIGARLRPGGLAYVSYNCLPGWSAEVPLVRLSNELAGVMPGTSAERARGAREAMELLARGGFRYFESTPAARAAVQSYQRADLDYLVHELLNPAWSAAYCVDVHRHLRTAAARYLGSATLADNHPALCVGDRAARLVAEMPPALTELALDFAANRQFRRDVFVVEPARAPTTVWEPALGCLNEPSEIAVEARLQRGEVQFDADFVAALRAVMVQGSLTVRELATRLAGAAHDPRAVTRNLHFAIAAGLLTPFPAARVERHGPWTRCASPTVERCLAQAARTDDSEWIPSAVAGTGIAVSAPEARRIQSALADGPATNADAALLERYGRLGLLT